MKKIIPIGVLSAVIIAVIAILSHPGAVPQPNQAMPPSQTVPPTETTTPQPTGSIAVSPTALPSTSGYKNGTYTGNSVDNPYGTVQVQVSIAQGKISNVSYLSLPNEAPNSAYISSQVSPMLKQEAIQAQSANVDIISGATATSEAFQESLQSALAKAS